MFYHPLVTELISMFYTEDVEFHWLPRTKKMENIDAESQLRDVFRSYKIHMVGGVEDVAYEGGALNCVSWNA